MVQRAAQVDRRAAGVSEGDLIARGFCRLSGFLNTTEQAELAPLFVGERRSASNRPPVSTVARLAGVARVVDCLKALLGGQARVVRVLALDKRSGGNWALGWHQDRVIEVAKQRDVTGFGPWTVKSGRPHAAPPMALLERMVTARLHLDDVGDGNAPLMVIPGSHRLGLIAQHDVAALVLARRAAVCLATAGDVWLYATPILHASPPAVDPVTRRVVQIDVSADSLPGGLEWPLLDGGAAS